MTTLVFNGFIRQDLLKAVEVAANSSFDVAVNFMDSPVTWTSTVPSGLGVPGLLGKPLKELLAIPDFKFRNTLEVRVTGIHPALGQDNAVVEGDIIRSPTDNSLGISFKYYANCPIRVDRHDCKYDINQTYILTTPAPPIRVVAYLYNECRNFLTGQFQRCTDLAQYRATNFTFTLTMKISLTVFCAGSSLENPICLDYCRENKKCLTEYVNYCFPDRIADNSSCQSYLQEVGPTPEFDQALEKYCKKYKGFGDLLNSTNQTDIDLCACHMAQDQYDNFSKQLFQTYTGFSETTLGINRRCLLPQCADSPYKTVATTKKCKVPTCLNFFKFDNNGNFQDSKIIVTQSSECANIRKIDTTPPKPPEPPETSTGVNWNLISGITLGVLILIIFLAIIFLGTSEK